jgi:murein L,D-transpeptidase YcbB/YkuD
MKSNAILIASLSVIIYLGCTNIRKKKKPVARDTSITHTTSFNTLFFENSELNSFITANPQYAPFTEQFNDFYKHRNYEFAWFDSTGLTEQAYNFVNLQNSYISEFGDSSVYNEGLDKLYSSLISKKIHPRKNDTQVLKTELLLTGQFFRYASKVYKGSDIDAKELGWFIPRKKINITALLDSAIQNKASETDGYVPLNPQYKQLQHFLSVYYHLNKTAESDSIAYLKKPLRKKDSSAVIIQIKKKLALFGDLTMNDSTSLFDTTLLRAVKSFQKRMGLGIDGIIGNKMIEELNVPVKQRIRQLLVNIERVRWMPPEKDTNYILVNIPEYKMHIFDSGRQQFDMNVIVGTAANSTVIFNGQLKYIVFSPYWNVPESIVKKEIQPAMKKNPDYLSKNNMEIYGKPGPVPNIRQKPGGPNSLGLVKFLFPNNYNIYFHDTPNRELFTQSSRSFSHGCIRLGEPKKFAKYLLRSDTSWTETKIDSAMHQSKEKWVTLRKGVPVFITYFTAWVDKTGQLNFRKDIYGHDEKMAAKLFTN